MKYRSLHPVVLILGAVFLLAATLSPIAAPSPGDDAREFVARYGEEWNKHWSADIVEAYPTGRSDEANDEKLSKFPAITTDWWLGNKHYIFEGDHYAVQWFFESKWKDNGKIQRESTLAFGIVKGGKLTSWTEFYDDTVGELQHDGKMGYYAKNEEPYPWPAKPGNYRPYRSYDGNSATWKNYP